MSQPITSALPQQDATALETLYEAVVRAQQAFDAIRGRIADGGKLQRLAPGVWVVTRDNPAEATP